MKKTFNVGDFARRLLAEALIYDEETGALGNVSLVDLDSEQERFMATYDPATGKYVIEEAVVWEEDSEREEDSSYAMAVQAIEYASFKSPHEAAEELLRLAAEHSLMPGFMLVYEEEA